MSDHNRIDRYEMIGRVWADLLDGRVEDSVFVEILDNGKVCITCMKGTGAIGIELDPPQAKKLRNALNRALHRIGGA